MNVFFLADWVVPEKIHPPTPPPPPTDGIVEILVRGGLKDSGNPVGEGG